MSPNLSALEGSGIPCGRGVLVDRHLRTRIPGVWAAGDCAELVGPGGQPNLVEQLWYTGRMQGEVLADNLAGGDRAYDRGIWFNSAKFLDLEWHTYGRVAPGPSPDGEERSLWWEDPSGMHALRVVHRDGVVTGVNAFGLRQRQEVWTRWLAEGRTVDRVVAQLPEANFDPELFRRWEPDIRSRFSEALQ